MLGVVGQQCRVRLHGALDERSSHLERFSRSRDIDVSRQCSRQRFSRSRDIDVSRQCLFQQTDICS